MKFAFYQKDGIAYTITVAMMKRRQFLYTSALAAGALSLGRLRADAAAAGGPFSLPPLPYPEDALAPHIDARTMAIHHGKHHAGYTRKLNAALRRDPSMASQPIEALLSGLDGIETAETRTAVRQNGGGYYNHRLFWEVMAPAGETGRPSAALREALEAHFGSFDSFRERFQKAALGCFGSGWAWLAVCGDSLKVFATPNQDNPLMRGIVPDAHVGTPILGVDVWEHAYYLNYQNRRGEYLDAWWNVVHWDEVSRRFESAWRGRIQA